MADEKTQITTRLIADHAVNRDKLHTTTEGLAVIAKIIEQLNSGIKIGSSTGADPGTGDVRLVLDFDLLNSLRLDEQLTGTVDGNNKVFSTSVPFAAGAITVFRCGLKCDDFTEVSDTQIELTEAPKNIGFNDLIEAIFIKKQV